MERLAVAILALAALFAAESAVAADLAAKKAATPVAAPSPAATGTAPGFAPPGQTLFAPVLEFAPPGPNRPERAIDLFSRQLKLQRLFAFHPEYTHRLQEVVDKMPPRQSTLIRASVAYQDPKIPWSVEPGGIHRIAVSGRPDGNRYLYDLSSHFTDPEVAQDFTGRFDLWPADLKAQTGDMMAELAGSFLFDTYGLGEIVDAAAAMIRQTRGDLSPPWDEAPGTYNHHDRAAMERFHRDLPAFAARVDHYLSITNVLDEFDGPGGPRVLFNFDAQIKPDALKPFPHLYKFYMDNAPRLTARTAIYDEHRHYWLQSRFERGRLRLIFMVVAGKLTPFDDGFQPAGEPVALDQIRHGRYQAVTSARVTSMRMDFGLDDLSFANDFSRDQNDVRFVGKMDAVPQLVAPVGLSQMMRMLAGEFLREMAQGNGGFQTTGFSHRTAAGTYQFGGGVRGEFHYSPALEFLARVGDSIAEAHNEKVRIEERKLGEELFEAFVEDYNGARAQILELEQARDHGR